MEHGGVLLVHEPEQNHLNTPFHIAAEMGWTQVIQVDICMCNITFMKVCRHVEVIVERIALGRSSTPVSH